MEGHFKILMGAKVCVHDATKGSPFCLSSNFGSYRISNLGFDLTFGMLGDHLRTYLVR